MISVVVPTKNSSNDLKNCLLSLKQTKPKEIVVVFDNKYDKNIILAKSFGAKVVFDKHHTIGGAYNTGVKTAKGDVIVFTDDDCVVPKNWISNIEKQFHENIDVIGGEDIILENSSTFQKAVYQIDKSKTLTNSVYGKKAKNRLRAANIAYRKSVFKKENFNPKLKGLQEPEFHNRLFKAGFKMKFDPKLYVFHKRRDSLKDVFKQIYRNGKAKIDVIKLHKDVLSYIDLVPFGYIFLTMLCAYFTFSINPLFFYGWAALTLGYFLLKPFMIVLKTKEVRYYPYLFLIIFVREVAYSLGILIGLRRLLRNK